MVKVIRALVWFAVPAGASAIQFLDAVRAQPLPQLSVEPTVASSRVLKFPEHISCGSLYREVVHSDGQQYSVSREYIGRAQGAVSVPANASLALYASYDLANHMQVLKALPPDALARIVFDRIETDKPLDLGCLSGLTGLVDINIFNCVITDREVSKLAALKKLRSLALWWGCFDGASFRDLVDLPELRSFDVGMNGLKPEAFASLGRMKRLRKLKLANTKLTDAELVEVGKITDLELLNISENLNITGRGLKHLKSCKNLRDIFLAKGKLSAQDILLLKGMKLRSLVVSGSKFSKSDWASLRAAFPQATITDSDPLDGETKNMFSPLH